MKPLIINWNKGNKKYILLDLYSIITIPLEYKSIANISMNNLIFKTQENDLIAFLWPIHIYDWEIQDLIKRNTKRIKITINIIQEEKSKVIVTLESYYKKLSNDDMLKDTLELQTYYWNEEMAKFTRNINIPEEGKIIIPIDFIHMWKSSYNKLEMCHYKSPVNNLCINWKAPILNLNRVINRKKGFDIMTNFSNKRIKINKKKYNAIQILIKLEINLKYESFFSKIIRHIIFNPIWI